MPSIVYNICPCCDSASIEPQLKAKDFTVSGEMFEIWECKHCTLRFTQSIPGYAEIGKYYQSEDYVSHTDSNKGIINQLYHFVRKRTLKKKQQQVQLYTQLRKGNLLDIGAGTGAFANYMQQTGWQVTGLEPDAATRQRANDLHGLQLQPTATLFDLSTSSFDAITMWHVLEHVHELHSYIDQIKKLLTANGKAFIAVPNYTSYDARVYKEFWAAYDVPRHLYHFSPAAMFKLMELHALKIRSILPMWYDSSYVAMLSEKNQKGGNHLLRAFTIGLLSNMNTVFNHQQCSSLIYIIEK